MYTVSVGRCRCVYVRARTHLQTPVTLCREQSIRGYVSKVKRILYVYFLPNLHYHEYQTLFLIFWCVPVGAGNSCVLVISVCVHGDARATKHTTQHTDRYQ